MDCARGIVNSGIKKVYCKEVCTTKNKDMWSEQQVRSKTLFEECVVELIFY